MKLKIAITIAIVLYPFIFGIFFIRFFNQSYGNEVFGSEIVKDLEEQCMQKTGSSNFSMYDSPTDEKQGYKPDYVLLYATSSSPGYFYSTSTDGILKFDFPIYYDKNFPQDYPKIECQGDYEAIYNDPFYHKFNLWNWLRGY